MHLHGRPQGGRARTDLLALHLVELAVAAGWEAGDCMEFARAAYKFIMSTRPEAATQQLVAAARELAEIRQPRGSKDRTGRKSLPHRPSCREWGFDPEAQRNALQTLADQNRTMRDAAEILGVSYGRVATSAAKLKISFHGRRGRRARPAAPTKTKPAAKLTKGTPTINSTAVATLVAGQPPDRRVKRRCPSCNGIFEPTEVNHYLCDDCEDSRYAGR